MFVPALIRAQATHYEQDAPSIIYTGTWYPNANSLESGGTSTLTNAKGAEVLLYFNGTGITWYGTSDPYAGECYVTVDGVQQTVDTSNPLSPDTVYRKKLFEVHNLAPGVHHMSIFVMHVRDASTSGSWVWVDGFDVDNGTLVAPPVAGSGFSDQTTSSANYVGHWVANNGAQFNGGTVDGTLDAGSFVDFSFDGTGVDWIGYRDANSGIAQASIDGTTSATVDTYQPTAAAQATVWSISGVAPGKHTLRITASGTHSSNSGDSWVYVDGFQVNGSALKGLPNIYSGGFVNAASFVSAPNNQIAPGQIIAIFGENFSAANSATASTIPLPTELGPQNTSITACGKTLPLFAVFPGQVNAQLPLECPSTGIVTAIMSTGGYTSSQAFTAAAAAPGIFTVNDSGTGEGVIVHPDNSLVTATKPATAGETIVIYATGLGPTSPAFATGAAATSANNTTLPVTVTIGGKPAVVMYSGLTQTLVGLYQVNAVVPAGSTGEQPVVITVNGMYSSRDGVTLAIR